MSESMTDADLAEMRARAEAATPGPWEKPFNGFFGSQIYSSSTQDDVIAEGVSIDDAAFIVHAREDVPRLLVEVERLRAENAALKDILRTLADEIPGVREVLTRVANDPVLRALFGETKASE